MIRVLAAMTPDFLHPAGAACGVVNVLHPVPDHKSQTLHVHGHCCAVLC